MICLPELIEDVALQHAPHRLAFYAQELAALFHAFYRDCRVIDPENAALSRARLELAQAAKLVLGALPEFDGDVRAGAHGAVNEPAVSGGSELPRLLGRWHEGVGARHVVPLHLLAG